MGVIAEGAVMTAFGVGLSTDDPFVLWTALLVGNPLSFLVGFAVGRWWRRRRT